MTKKWDKLAMHALPPANSSQDELDECIKQVMHVHRATYKIAQSQFLEPLQSYMSVPYSCLVLRIAAVALLVHAVVR